MSLEFDYRQNAPLETGDIIRVLVSSRISRPTCDPTRIGRMFANSNLVLSAWRGDRLVGVARAITDFASAAISPILRWSGNSRGRASGAS